MPTNENAAPGVAAGAAENDISNDDECSTRPARPVLKWKRVLQAFVDGRSLNRFEAARNLRDWCLPSTVAGLELRGVRIERRDEVVPGYQGIPIHVKRYWIAPESHRRARELLRLPDSHGGAAGSV